MRVQCSNVGRAWPNFSAKLQLRTLRAAGDNHRRAAKILAFLVTLRTKRSPNIELSLIVLARSPIPREKIFPSQRQMSGRLTVTYRRRDFNPWLEAYYRRLRAGWKATKSRYGSRDAQAADREKLLVTTRAVRSCKTICCHAGGIEHAASVSAESLYVSLRPIRISYVDQSRSRRNR